MGAIVWVCICLRTVFLTISSNKQAIDGQHSIKRPPCLAREIFRGELLQVVAIDAIKLQQPGKKNWASNFIHNIAIDGTKLA